ncbi:MAG: DnaB-like helicase N-terminal domain-containing protein [Christensenellales bacterium]
MPHSDDAEQAVLGCVLIDEDAPVAIISELKPEDFYEPAHKQIFTAMSALYNRDKPIDYVTLVEEPTEAGVIDSVGGMSYIISLTNYVPSAANYRHYLEIVKRRPRYANSFRRRSRLWISRIRATRRIRRCRLPKARFTVSPKNRTEARLST